MLTYTYNTYTYKYKLLILNHSGWFNGYTSIGHAEEITRGRYERKHWLKWYAEVKLYILTNWSKYTEGFFAGGGTSRK